MGFLKYNRFFVFLSGLVIVGYGVYFYMQGYQAALGMFAWAGLVLAALYLAKTNPHIAFLSLFVVSIAFYYILKYYIPVTQEAPHFQVLICILFLYLGCGIDGLYWVHKYARGTKFRNDYD